MISCVVPEKVLQGIKGQSVSAVIVNRLHSRKCEKSHSATDPETRDLVGHSCSDGVHEETFEGMVVESAERVRNIKTMMARMKCLWVVGYVNLKWKAPPPVITHVGALTVKPWDLVHEPMQEVLPCIHDEDRNPEASSG